MSDKPECGNIPGDGPACDWDPGCTTHFPETSWEQRYRSSVETYRDMSAAFARQKRELEEVRSRLNLVLGLVQAAANTPDDKQMASAQEFARFILDRLRK